MVMQVRYVKWNFCTNYMVTAERQCRHQHIANKYCTRYVLTSPFKAQWLLYVRPKLTFTYPGFLSRSVRICMFHMMLQQSRVT